VHGTHLMYVLHPSYSNTRKTV